MDFKGSQQTPIFAIPKDIAEVLEEIDIKKMWDYLEKTFRLNKKNGRQNLN